jgi:dTDP-glucose 4,6-dehydratase
MAMRLLITGGAGFMGSNFVRYLCDSSKEFEITVLDALTYAGSLTNLSSVSNKINFIHGDIRDEKLVEEICGQTDVIVNFAAETHNDNSLSGPDIFIETNIHGTYNLIKFARKFNIRFHQVSTDEVYGDMPIGSQERFDESTPFKPSSPYSASKAAADLLVKAWHRSFGLQVTVSHSSNNFGLNQYPEKLIPFSLNLIKNNNKLRIYGDGKNVRDWLYVDDHSRAILSILEKGKVGESYNISSNQLYNNLKVAEMINSSYNRPRDNIEFINDRLGHDLQYALSSKKLRNQTGWEPKGPSLPEWLTSTAK